jgi:hypothetical protein
LPKDAELFTIRVSPFCDADTCTGMYVVLRIK